jgi:hypothetical protein
VVFWLLILNKKVSKEKFEIVSSNTTYVKDTNTHKAVVNNSYTNSYPIRVIETTLPVVIDSEYVFKSYFNKYVYERTFDDSLITWKMIDTISQNRFSQLSNYRYTLKRPTKIITNTYSPINKLHVYIGGRTNIGANTLSLTPTLGLITKSNWMFDVGYTPHSKSFQIGAYYKIAK